jgi:hypothetical protein
VRPPLFFPVSRRISKAKKEPRYALAFDGIDDIVICGTNVPAPVEAVTIEVWAQLHEGGSYPRILARESNWGLLLHAATPYNRIRWFGSGVDDSIGFYSFKYRRWYHLAVVYDGERIRGLVNGVRLGEGIPKTGDLTHSPTVPVTIGNRADLDRPFSGVLRDCRLWSVARSDEEIRLSMYSIPDANDPTLIGHWLLNEGNGDVAMDRSQYLNHGIIHGATWVEV